MAEKDSKIEELMKHECKIPNDITAKIDTAESKFGEGVFKFFLTALRNKI